MGIDNILNNNEGFKEWQIKNRLFGKNISVFGDSISTFDGYNPDGYKIFYNEEKQCQAGLKQVTDTWWQTVIDFFGAKLLVNNSWSGSRVTKLPGYVEMFPSACSDERTSSLHIGEIKPDCIFVFLGTNDWAFGARTGNETRNLVEDDNEVFEEAYDSMLKKLKVNYPKSEIWCCTLCETYVSKCPAFQFPHKYAGTHIEEYNDIIRKAVRCNNDRLIDLYDYKMAYDSIDGTHPNSAGMNTISKMVIRSIAGFDVDRFLDCENDLHNYRVVKEYTGGTRYICSQCGKSDFWSSLLSAMRRNDQPKKVLTVLQEKEANNAIEYVVFDPTGKTIDDKYKVLALLGRGAFFATYLVRDIRTSKVLAMKSCDKKSRYYSSEIRDFFLTEPYMMQKLDHHAIPKVADIIENEDIIIVVRDYIEGETLETIVKRHGAQSADMVVEWVRQICSTLSYLHSHNPPLIYCDMKPANVLLKPDGTIKFIDFGTMLYNRQNKSGDTCRLSTEGYAAPEQYGGLGQLDERTDIFGLGMTIHHLVTGVDPRNPPYETKPICQINPTLPKGLEYIISKCTEINPDNRYQSCDELMADLNNYMNLPKPKGIFGKLFGKK